jgi:exonuclease SbcC
MKPLRLTVRAFGPYAAEQVFDFDDLRGRSFFLIHGPTGAGKTSVLDAICFALYGQASGTLRTAKELRSDHADPQTPTQVTFDFRVGEKRYRASRSPEQERPAKRKNKEGVIAMVRQDQDATLWDRSGCEADDEPGDVLADGWSDVTAEVERLLGFRCEQFRQVVLLPQGQFQRLLMDKSADRQQVLETLFQVHVYARIERALKDAAAGLYRQHAQATTRRAEVLGGANVTAADALTERRVALEADVAAAKEASAALKAARAAAQERLAAARDANAKLTEHAAAREALRQWEGRKDEFLQKQTAHARACKAAAIVEAEGIVTRLRADAASLEQKLEAARASLAAARAAKEKADATKAAEDARAGERDAARQRVAQLDALAGKVKELDDARRAAATASRDRAAKFDAREKANATLLKRRDSVAKAADESERLKSAHAELPSINLALKSAGEQLARQLKLAELDRAVADALDAARKSAERATGAVQVAEWARAARDRVRAVWESGQAAILAEKLVEGCACPVCGSTEHPAPAHGEGKLPSQADVEAGRVKADDADRAAAEAKERAAKDEAALAAARAAAASLRDGNAMRIGPDADALRAEVDRLRAARDLAEAAGLDLDKAVARLATLREAEAADLKLLAAADAALEAATAAHTAAAAVLAERETGVPEALRAPDALARECRAAAAVFKRLTDAFDSAQKLAQDASVALARAEADEAGFAQSARARRAEAEAEQKAFVEKAKAAGFDSHAAFLAAKRSDEETARLDEEVRQYHVEMGAARARLAKAQESAAGVEAPDLAALQAAAAEADRALEENTARASQFAEQLRGVRATLERLSELDEKLKELDAQYGLLGGVADVANGRNEYRMTFQRYVLGAFLDEVLCAATQRLHIMSRGRFLLQRAKDPVTGRVAGGGGLDLEVYDHFTSTARPVGSLSGGESFLASLALALGLADVVQSHAGGIRLETIFVDEGFGTLDPESLDLAIRALQDLQQGGRLVGIISHVTELRELIDARLEVSAGRRGSTARFVVG